MIIFYILSSVAVALFVLYVFSTMCRTGHEGLSALRGWAYAHRGLHGGADVPENSLEAFRLAVAAGYGSELDVHLLTDGNLAVIHDSTLKRTTGVEGRIEDLTIGQLANYRLEGTNQTIPTLESVLEIYPGTAPLIIELKPIGTNHTELCSRVCKLLDTYEGEYCIESFDPRCVYWLKKNRPDIIRGQLTENFFLAKNSQLPWVVKFALKFQLLNFLIKPDFVAYKYRDRNNFSNFLCRKLWGAQGVTWTLTTKQEFDTAVSEGWIPIFEGFRP